MLALCRGGLALGRAAIPIPACGFESSPSRFCESALPGVRSRTRPHIHAVAGPPLHPGEKHAGRDAGAGGQFEDGVEAGQFLALLQPIDCGTTQPEACPSFWSGLRSACQRHRRPLCLSGYLLAARSYSRDFLLVSLTLPAFSSRSRQLAMAPGERLIPRPTTPEVAGNFFGFRFM